MADNKIFVYAPSMAIVTWAARRWLWNDLTIISNNPQIITFCLKCGICVVEIKSNEDTSFTGLINYKKYVIDFAKQFSNCSFIFGHNSHDYWGLFLIYCLRKNGNTIYYNSQIKEHPKLLLSKKLFAKKHRRLFFDSLILLFVLKQKFDVLSFGEYSFIGIDIERILKKYTKNLTPVSDEIFSLNQNHVIFEYNIADIKIILIEQGEAFYKYTDELIENLISLSNNYPEFYLKQHPSFKTTREDLLKNVRQLPVEIPVELIATAHTILIGIASNAIINHKRSISLLYLVEIETNQIERYKCFLNSTQIIYPQNIAELQNELLTLIKQF